MALIPFIEKAIDFRTEMGIEVRVTRPYLEVELLDEAGNDFQRLSSSNYQPRHFAAGL